MIVGNGMIATAFKNIDYDLSDYILFASGVSNSKCRDFGEFNREFLTLKNTLDNNKTLIYFSTSSVFDPGLQNSEYVKHKLILEKYIQENFKNYIIYRLPNVIGKTVNPNTMINYFSNAIWSNSTVNIFRNSTRYIIDIDDVIKYVLLTKGITNSIINLNFNIKYYVIDIWKEIEILLNKKGKSILINKGIDYDVDNSLFTKVLGEINIPDLNNENYLIKVLKKHL